MATLNHAPDPDPDSAGIDIPTHDVRRDRYRLAKLYLRRWRSRPTLLLAAAGALAIAALAAGVPTAATEADAETVSRSTRVAAALGLDSTQSDAVTRTQDQRLLEQLAASRAQRDGEAAAAAQTQAQAEQVAAAARAEAEAAAARAAAETEAALQSSTRGGDAEAVMPIDGARLTSTFGPRWGTLHGGVDLAAPMMTPEYAAMDGIVLQAGPASGFGLAVYIQHSNGDVTVYGHMEQILVEAGQTVQAGDTIALVGNRGQSTGPHLHFEVRIGGLSGEPVDPLSYLRERGVDV